MAAPVAGTICRVLPTAPSADTLLRLHAAWPARYPVLLDSAATGTPQGRWSILMALPGERLSCQSDGQGFLDELDAWCAREGRVARPAEVPFAGGWFIYLAYELAQAIEPSLRLPMQAGAPLAIAWRMHGAILLDHQTGLAYAVAEDGHERGIPDMLADLDRDLPSLPAPPVAIAIDEDEPARFIEACRRAQQHIAAGDVYQANLARSWRVLLPKGASKAALYARLRGSNPGPFAGIAELGQLAILSSSPERLVRLADGRLDTRPIAGTRPRLPSGDAEAIAALLAHPKERAEHVMLIDLERSDLGRIARPGSVHVDEFMAIESYAHVHHIVSNVTAQLRDGITPAAVIRALFPGGTITGCPKVRCMALIAELEGAPRGAYTGSMGYIGRDGSLDLNILIRTLAVTGDFATLHAGAGIVADSIPARELEETRAKARGVLRAFEVAA